MKKIFTTIIIGSLFAFVAPSNLFSQIQDNVINDPGDIAFVTFFGTVSTQGISFVFLDNCPAGTTISFCDDEWTGTAFATATGEGELGWTNSTGAVIPRGTVINMMSTTGGNAWTTNTVNIGTLAQTEAGFSIGPTNDQVFAYTGTTRATPGIFLAFYGCASGCQTANTLMGTGLTGGVTATVGGDAGNNLFYGGSPVCNGTIVACATMINTLSNWAVGTYPASIPAGFTGSALPVELISFDAKSEQQGNLLLWATATERNSYGFEIERSANGMHYERIGFIPGKGNSSTRQNYTFKDKTPLKGDNYYRLRMMDLDGKDAYSPIKVLNNGAVVKILLSPNPIKQGDSARLLYESTDEEDLVITIFNTLGANVSQQQFSVHKGKNEILIDLSRIISGRYFAHTHTSSGSGNVVQLAIE